ncbi:MarR family winged helix-turn-helix transcriptional regulator [Cohaesibacter celericrescens]|uniref:MarR family transcriptional regulator n=1 Tax=Cohaesibacter celericrescens TaxID=2067669 RepID=A0A2N5XNA5_9HYPH|nr:MarR family winged helix-turn-helix transcriptional regulator [Cohaesibacter celericrescens]PLW76026.1 MarR family transcriptional regulator [Cohaesibacter celericrescens]
MPDVERTSLPDFDLMHFTPYRLAVAAQSLSEELAHQYKERFGISIPEWRVIVHVAHAGGASVRDIEARVGMEKSKVSRAATRLEQRGLVTKEMNAKDRRLIHLTLTDEGHAMMVELLPMAQAFQKEVEARLAENLGGLEAGLDRILQGVVK